MDFSFRRDTTKKSGQNAVLRRRDQMSQGEMDKGNSNNNLNMENRN